MANPTALREPCSAPPSEDHERLEAWKAAVELAVESYQLSASLPCSAGRADVMALRQPVVRALSAIEAGWRARWDGRLPAHLAEAGLALAELAERIEEVMELPGEGRANHALRARAARALELCEAACRAVAMLREASEGLARHRCGCTFTPPPSGTPRNP